MNVSKAEMKMYAVGISTDEAFEWITKRFDEFKKLWKEAGVKVGYSDPQGRFQAFLFMTPRKRDQAYTILKEKLKSAVIIAPPFYIHLGEIQSPINS